jgi:two-component system sensor histidine kinase MprB
VAARLQDDALVIEDTGSGIAPVDLPHVFERFYRGRDAQGRPGHGLGLAIVKHLCDQHDWTLTLESEAGRGTRVRLRFAKAVVVDENLTLP